MQRSSHKRFLLIGGPKGYLSCLPAGDPRLHDYYRRWIVLIKVNRPLSISLCREAQRWAVYVFKL